jgi:hypothetical protein
MWGRCQLLLARGIPPHHSAALWIGSELKSPHPQPTEVRGRGWSWKAAMRRWAPNGWSLGEEGCMVHEDRWREIHRMHREQRAAIPAIARRLELDRKTVRRCLRQERWQAYQRAPASAALQELRAARSVAPRGHEPEAALCQLPRPPADRGSDGQDAKNDAECGPTWPASPS